MVFPEFVRDAAMTGAIFGFFGSMWFGWAQEAPPPRWRKVLIAGSALSIMCLIAGGLLAWQHWSDGSVFDGDIGRSFGIIVGIEFGVAGLGAGLLTWRGKSEFISAWIALVVGLHFFPLAVLFKYPLLHATAALTTAAAIYAVIYARRKGITISAVVGVAVGKWLLLSALISIIWALLQ